VTKPLLLWTGRFTARYKLTPALPFEVMRGFVLWGQLAKLRPIVNRPVAWQPTAGFCHYPTAAVTNRRAGCHPAPHPRYTGYKQPKGSL